MNADQINERIETIVNLFKPDRAGENDNYYVIKLSKAHHVAMGGMYFVFNTTELNNNLHNTTGLVFKDAALTLPLDWVTIPDDVGVITERWRNLKLHLEELSDNGVTVEAEPVDDEVFEVDVEDETLTKPLEPTWTPKVGDRVHYEGGFCTVYGRVHSIDEDRITCMVTSSDTAAYALGELTTFAQHELSYAPLPELTDQETAELIRDYINTMFRRYSDMDIGKYIEFRVTAAGNPNGRSDVDLTIGVSLNYGSLVKASTLSEALDVAARRYREDERLAPKMLPRY
jgi:hypothetical protein